MSQRAVSPRRARLRRLAAALKRRAKAFRRAIFSINALIIAVATLVMLVLFTLAIVPVRYDIAVGMVPAHTIAATRDVVDEYSTELRRRQAALSVQPKYVYEEGVTEAVLYDLDQIFTQLDAAIQYSETLEDKSPTRRYTADELAYAGTIVTLLELKDYQMRTLLNMTEAQLSALYNTLYAVVQNNMYKTVTEGAETEVIASIRQIIGYSVEYNVLENIALPALRAVIRPNMVIDQEATEAAREAAREAVEPVVYKQGQNILVKGEGTVERHQYETLASLGLLSSASVDMSIYPGAALLVVLVFAVALALLRLASPDDVSDPRRLLLLCVIAVLTLGACILMRMFDLYLAPAALAGLLAAATLSLEAGVILNAALTLLVSALAAGGDTAYTAQMVQLICCNLCSGAVGAMLLFRRSNRLRVIAAGVAVGAIDLCVMLSLGLMTSGSWDTTRDTALRLMGSGLLSGLLCIALQPLLELAFNLPTQNKLLELSDPNHPLLRRLLLEAPGTYHHALLVANLAEAAAEAIGANPLLARVGGYYHDIGKLRRPQYFKENQADGENKLIETDPYTAAQIVISHTHDGVTLARAYHLPREIIRIIQEHHGNTPVMYFYAMACKNADGREVNINDFRYDANPPATKEGAIVLLCDTIEAAVRSMRSPTPEAIEEFIVKLIRGKLQDGQLSNSPLTLRDIDSICRSSATVLSGVFHERIEYPEPPAAPAQPAEQKAAEQKPDEQKTAEQKPAEQKAEDEPAAAPAPDEALTKPWDGESSEEAASNAAEEAAPPAPVIQPGDLPQPKQILVDPSQFEPSTPLPVVEPPKAEAPMSIEEAMERKATDGTEAAPDEEEGPLT